MDQVSYPQLEVEQAVRGVDESSTDRMPRPAAHRLGKDVLIFALAAAVCFGVTRGLIAFMHSPDRGLPYADHFATGDNTEWSAYGGNWRVEDGSMVNESNERGAKLVAGSPYWANYAIEADVALRSLGDAGLMARVSDAEQGVDAYSGIYVGLRMRDQVLVIGRADHDWQEDRDASLSSPIAPNTWYHFQIKLNGCTVSAIVRREDSSEMGRAETTVDSCPLRGKIGLRSYDSGGIWRHISVTRLATSH
jgi:Domain of Unknown Function (DUF1080)